MRIFPIRKSHALFLLLLICSTFLITYILVRCYVFESSIARYTLVQPKKHHHLNEKKVILFYTNFFKIPFWSMPQMTNDEAYLKSINCPVTNCILTHDKNYLEKIHMYDALVFHGAESWLLLDLPETRSSKQLYVVSMLESPAQTRHNLRLDHDFFNLTMTYRLDSDILWSYRKLVEKSSGNVVAPSVNVKWRQPDVNFKADKDLHLLLQNKSKTAAWFVSNCNAHSDRDKLTEHLQKYIDVDVYGRCGPLKCPYNDSSTRCEDMLDTTYKFYLSFENSLCIDYVTEKLYRAMSNSIIPIVFNGANMKYFVPPMSVIDANDFESVEDLAVHLKFLSNNLEEYEKYFWWKEHYEVTAGDTVAYCDLCMKVNEMNSKHKRQVYEDISQWWVEDACNESRIKI